MSLAGVQKIGCKIQYMYIRKPDTVRLSDSTHVRDADLSGFRMVKTSLDRFINKGHKNIFFMPK
jgi:hypothetical protein